MKYNILYKEIQIGVLEVDENGRHRYTPNEDGINDVKNEVSLIREMLETSDWRDPIPFFKERIENASRFNSLDVISYHTDSFKMVKQKD